MATRKSDPEVRESILRQMLKEGGLYLVHAGEGIPSTRSDAGGKIVLAKNIAQLQEKLGLESISSRRFRLAVGSLMYNPARGQLLVRCRIDGERHYKLLLK